MPRRPGHMNMHLSKDELDAMVEEATIDAYGEEEQRVGFLTMMEDNLKLPFETKVLGTPVTVQRLEMTRGDEIVAICVRGKDRLPVPILDLPLPSPAPDGAKWIAAYRYWLGGS